MVFYLPILRTKSKHVDEDGDEDGQIVLGLALELVDDSLQIFKRVGVISTQTWEWFHDAHQGLLL